MSYKLLGLVAFVAVCSAVKIPVTVYYESLCPDSAAFITQQLFPVAKNELKDFIDITWIPFGKANYTTRGSEVEFKCHHGPNECYGNKVHACAIKHIQANSYQNEHTRESLILDFVNCLMMTGKNFPDDLFGEKCAKDTQINNWGVIQQCAKGEEGSQFLKEFGDRTAMLRPNLTSVPTIVFNQQYDQDNQAKALVNFRGALCKFISQPQPQVCSANNSGGIPFNTISTWLSVVALALARLL